MRVALLLAGATGAVVVTVIVYLLSTTIPTQDYALSVDALKDQQSLFTDIRVVIKNTGRNALTNVTVDYGAKQDPPVPRLGPGEQLMRYPPEGVQLDSVTVTADNGIKVVSKYRSPIKLPGMMGS